MKAAQRRSGETTVEIGRGWPAWVLALGLALPACGPLISTAELTDARDAVERARDAEAESYAVYEFVSAEEYLAKAEEEWGYADWQKAKEYAVLAQEFAEEAYERALRNPERGSGGFGGFGDDDR